MEEDTASLGEIKVDGGASQNGFLLQFQADLLGRRIVRPDNVEATAQGAAFLAGLASGMWRMEELPGMLGGHTAFEPRMTQPERDKLCSGWEDAVRRTRSESFM